MIMTALPVLLIAILTAGMTGCHEKQKIIRYAALGDSYTIGEGIEKSDRWPNQLAARINQAGIEMEIVVNPSRTGWTTQDVLDKEMPVFLESDADFATLLIGVNDWVQDVSSERFRENFVLLLEKITLGLKDSGMLVIVTIPDFSVTPEGPQYSRGRDISAGLKEFNRIILEESSNRGLAVVDIFALSRTMGGDPGMTASDGLHPSAKAYSLWVDKIFPVVYEKLK